MAKHRRHRQGLLWICFAAVLGGCDTDGDACFGLCSKADDNRTTQAGGSTVSVNRSCYTDDSLGAAETLSYADTTLIPSATLLFQAASAATPSNPRPLLIWVTGRSWSAGNDAADAPSIARATAAELGAHFARVNYRDDTATQWPQPIIDINTAIRYLKNQTSARNIDSGKILLGGDQAGAHLAALAATSSGIQEFIGDQHLSQSSTVSALIALGGLYDFDTFGADADALVGRCGTTPSIAGAPIRRLFDCAAAAPGAAALSECDANQLQQASPVFHASSDDPPGLIWHGDLDCSFPAKQSERLHERLTSQSTTMHGLHILATDDASLATLNASDVEIEVAKVLTCEDT